MSYVLPGVQTGFVSSPGTMSFLLPLWIIPRLGEGDPFLNLGHYHYLYFYHLKANKLLWDNKFWHLKFWSITTFNWAFRCTPGGFFSLKAPYFLVNQALSGTSTCWFWSLVAVVRLAQILITKQITLIAMDPKLHVLYWDGSAFKVLKVS